MGKVSFENTKYLKYADYKTLKDFNYSQLEILSQEIRDYITEVIYHNGGHFGSNLGIVELTISILRNYNPERDKIVFDTSHQSYVYKILTDRKEKFQTLRSFGGISGFSKIKESKFDHFGAGHAGTGLSAALGYAKARDISKQDYEVVCIIGDAALTCGVTFEAINNLGQYPTKMTIVLNDNEYSISRNVGAISMYLKRLRNNPIILKVEEKIDDILAKLPVNSVIKGWIRDTKSWVEEGFTKLVSPSIVGVIFEEFGIQYIGPINGHDIKLLDDVFAFTRSLNKPVIVHVITQKGKGNREAENHSERMHGVAKGKIKPSHFIYFSTDEGMKFDEFTKGINKTYTEVFSEAIVELARKDEKIIAITAAMPSGTGLVNFSRIFPDRFFDVGIAEEHAVIFACGLALAGLKPVVAIYSTFLQRAFDMLIHDVALQNIPILFVLDRAGIVGEDGPTHHGVFDLSYLRIIPNVEVFAPSDEVELRNILYTVLSDLKKPTFVRYPRDFVEGLKIGDFEKIDIYKWKLIYRTESEQSKSVCILSTGRMKRFVSDICRILEGQGVSVTAYNCISVKPLDTEVLRNLEKYDLVLTLEDNVLAGGFASYVLEYLNDNDIHVSVLRIGWKDEFVEHGSMSTLFRHYGIEPNNIANQVLERLFDKVKVSW
ncbi:MAG: 1-deoxy-D-xylulose-5-phosphate synthase [Candidatus Calescibacterium sp.]|nr:1-deoxy-D-xylulose-5-phosphate synthase [Candidatus Calescibacterium sp.]MCX7972598.1 1-deoxy-D-xylulose-5-phosphate synthase [bacterium]MDW8195767.1 1-deoxy-D-xylulose-5-phosphate synthase [Candidatus Calescibacterium sp.]